MLSNGIQEAKLSNMLGILMKIAIQSNSLGHIPTQGLLAGIRQTLSVSTDAHGKINKEFRFFCVEIYG